MSLMNTSFIIPVVNISIVSFPAFLVSYFGMSECRDTVKLLCEKELPLSTIS